MAVTTTNLIQGPGTLYTGAFGATEPLDTAVGDAPDSGVWTDVGGTTDGVQLSIMQEFSELAVDQIVDVPGRRLVKRDLSLTTNMAEPTLANLAAAMNLESSSVTDGSGFKKLEPSSDTSATQPTYKALILDGFAPEQLTRRVIVRKVLSTNNVDFAYQKDAQTVFSVTWSAHYVSSAVKPFAIVDEETV
jgi:hypothetical protein